MSHNSLAIIEKAIAKLRLLVKQEVQYRWHDLGTELAQELEEYSIATTNDRGYLVFPQRRVKWLAQWLTIPTSLQGYPLQGLSLRLVLTWWANDAQIYINGELVQRGDLFDSSARVLITDNARSGEKYLVTMRLVSPNHDIGALMRSHLIYEASDSGIDPGLVADELTVLCKYITQLEPERTNELVRELELFDWCNVSQAAGFNADLERLRSRLLPLAQNIKQRRFNLLGHAHLDMAWLWTSSETYEVAERTFKSVLSLQQEFPSLIFGHTSPALYEWIEHHRPELFELIKTAIEADKWEILGGMWIEPETNLVSGESLIRQLIYGQRYYRQRFGKISTVAWLPDSFGFTWQLPQIFQLCGIEYFVTGKLHWNDSTKFPHGCFWWSSPDGTQLLTLMSPPNVTGVMDTDPIVMTDYAVEWEVQTGLREIFWLPGVGDHGGGPTRDMLAVANKWRKSPFFPQLEFTTAADCLKRINSDRKHNEVDDNEHQFPVWHDELYLELHRGCYTVHADQKRYNRRCERLLYEAELWSSLAILLCGELDVKSLSSELNTVLDSATLERVDPNLLLEIAWKKVLFNQFHDILPGTSIPEVFTEANRDWLGAIAISKSLLQQALNTITAQIELPEPPQAEAIPIVVFNSLNWKRSQLVTVEDSRFGAPTLAYYIHNEREEQEIANCRREGNKLTFYANDIPGIGYRLFWLCPERATAESEITAFARDRDYQLSNSYLKIVVNPHTGNLDSIYDLVNNREILAEQGNELQAFADEGQYWDAWNIDPEYEQKRLPETVLESIEWIETGLTDGIRVVRRLERSLFIQDYILEPNVSLLKIVTQVDWQETHVMVKAAFPLNLHSERVTYEIPGGAIERPTQPKTAAERAKWEVPALNWADLTDTEQNYGVSLLNDCKYGYDASPDRLRLTLLRAATWPDPQSDRGVHHFTYSIYPHKDSWQAAKTVQKGYELNTPLQPLMLKPQPNRENSKLPRQSELLNLSAPNLVLTALQTSNDGDLVMRCYESTGEETKIELRSDLDLQLGKYVDCLGIERAEEHSNLVKPYKIVSFQLEIADRSVD